MSTTPSFISLRSLRLLVPGLALAAGLTLPAVADDDHDHDHEHFDVWLRLLETRMVTGSIDEDEDPLDQIGRAHV